MQQRSLSPNACLERLKPLFPEGWEIVASGEADARLSASRAKPDTMLELTAPDGACARLALEVKSRLSASQARDLASQRPPMLDRTQADGALVCTRFVSQLARERLRKAGICYLDLTGNAWIRLERPAVLIERQGAEKDPDPPRRGVKSLKGAKAARLVRGLADWLPPMGVRELAGRVGTDPGYASRVLSLLEAEDVIERSARGEVVEVRWQDLLRRWAQDYGVRETNRVAQYLAPRGLPWVRERLTGLRDRYALTGSSAVPPGTAVVAGPLLTCYSDDPEDLADRLDLRGGETGANVLLVQPFDPVVYERCREMEGLTLVALSQCAVDLLTGSGREPAQGEALIAWMEEHEDAWRA